MDGDPTTGMLVGETQAFPDGNRYGEYRIGGTSLASPLFTGMQALAAQTAGRQGFLNPAIYEQARTGAGTFNDVKPVHTGDGNVRVDYANSLDASGGLLYSIRTFNEDSSLKTRNGWDEVTGVGVPSPAYLGSYDR
jgi:subtilase family serine protease